MKKIEKIAKWVCRKLTREQVELIILMLTNFLKDSSIEFKKTKPDYPNYRKFTVDPEPPLDAPKEEKVPLNYKEIIKKENIKPVNHRGKQLVEKHIKCPHCNAPHAYIYVNNGNRKSVQYRCKVCQKTFCETPKISQAKYYCPICGKALYKWKDRLLVTMYKCGNDKCQRYLDNLEKLSPEEKIIREQKQSQFKLRYIYRDYKINLKEILNIELQKPMQKLDQFRYSLNTICLALTFHVTLQLSTRQTAFALRRIFGIRISHTTVARIAGVAATICHQFNLKNIPKVSGEQAADETYIKVKGKHHYIWLAVAKFRSIITAYFVSDNRGEIPAIITLNMAAEKHLKVNEEEPLLLGVDGNPSYMAATTFLKKQGIDIDLKQVIGLENKDEISAAYRDLKNLIERLNRTIKSQAHNNFQMDSGADSYTALAVTNYNFIRPHSSLNYQPPVVLDELKDTLLLQDVWSKILRSA